MWKRRRKEEKKKEKPRGPKTNKQEKMHKKF